MTATYARRCRVCDQLHLCQQVIRLCVCQWCQSDHIETVAVTPDPDAPDWIARWWREARDG